MIKDIEKLKCPKCGSRDLDANRYPECYYLACVDCGHCVDGESPDDCISQWKSCAVKSNPKGRILPKGHAATSYNN